MTAHPPGCLEYREAVGPSGVYGKWLRDKDIARYRSLIERLGLRR